MKFTVTLCHNPQIYIENSSFVGVKLATTQGNKSHCLMVTNLSAPLTGCTSSQLQGGKKRRKEKKKVGEPNVHISFLVPLSVTS